MYPPPHPDPPPHMACSLWRSSWVGTDQGLLWCRWVQEAGGSVTGAEGVEVSPLVSYAGEGLADLCSGKTFQQGFDSSLQVCYISNT